MHDLHKCSSERSSLLSGGSSHSGIVNVRNRETNEPDCCRHHIRNLSCSQQRLVLVALLLLPVGTLLLSTIFPIFAYAKSSSSSLGAFLSKLTMVVNTPNVIATDNAKESNNNYNTTNKELPYILPPDFIWGVATSSYQIEGAIEEDSRGPSIWDAFCKLKGTILDGSDGRIACDHYHRVVDDVLLMEKLNIKAYRFSISWSRILPNGTGLVNSKGIAFYNFLIDTLIEHDIDPWVTLFHWDLPEPLYQIFGGWLDQDQAIQAFTEYALVCFEAFGDRVKRWITINEAWTVAVNGHGTGVHAPGHQSNTEPYRVAHTLILAHATVARLYRERFASVTKERKGLIGMSNCGDFRYPLTWQDYNTAERAMLFQFGWFTDPFFFGDYPTAMRQRLGSRLPQWTEEERQIILGSVDFIGLNYYSSLQASTPRQEASWEGYWADIFVDFSFHPEWQKNDMGWGIVPDGLREMLLWVSRRYNNPLLFITENGSAEHEPDLATALQDERRVEFLQGHLRACAQALEENRVNLQGYFAWSLMDNFEWQFGYQRRFGLCRVDFDNDQLVRTPKSSAHWYNRTILEHGRNMPRFNATSWFPPNPN